MNYSWKYFLEVRRGEWPIFRLELLILRESRLLGFRSNGILAFEKFNGVVSWRFSVLGKWKGF